MFIRLSDLEAGEYRVQFYDLNGKIVRSERLVLDVEEGSIIKEIHGMNQLSKGVYIVRITGLFYTKEFKYILQ